MPVTGGSGVHQKGYIAGGPEIQAQLQRLRRGLADAVIAQATLAGAEVIADEWRTQARSRLGQGTPTGHYVDAIGVSYGPGDEGAVATVWLKNSVPLADKEDHPRVYAKTLEFGQGNRPAKPTLRPSFDASKNRSLEAIANKLRELVNKAI